MSMNQSDKDDDVLSEVEQPVEESQVGTTSPTARSPIKDLDELQLDNGRPTSSSMAGRTRSMGASGATAKAIGTSEDDLTLAAEGMDELEQLSDQVAQFEQLAFETKKRVNALDRLAYKSQLFPPTIRLCFQALIKSCKQDGKQHSKVDFDAENLEASILDTIKTSGECIKQFGKFKGEFFALNEPIMNKDISSLTNALLQTQLDKQQVQVEKLTLIEDHFSENDAAVEELKEKYERFQREKFEDMFRNLDTEGQEVKELVTETEQQGEKVTDMLGETQAKLKDARPGSREQRAKHSEVFSKLQKAERRFQKWKSNFEAHSSKHGELNAQIDGCQQIVETLEELQIKTMVAQSKKLQKLVDCTRAIAAYRARLQALTEESDLILQEVGQIEEQAADFVDSLQADLIAEYDELISKIKQHSQDLEEEVSTISDSLTNFESKVGDMKISDQDHFFLNKEILRYRTAVNSLDSQRGLYMEETEGIEDKFSMAGALEGTKTSPISQEELQKLRDNLKHLQKQEEVEIPKVKKAVEGLEQFVTRSLKNQLNDDNKRSQTQISKVKKSYEEFLRQFERLNQTYNECVQKVNNFNSKFNSDDLERMNQLKELQERLKEEESGITGAKKANEDGEQREEDGELTDMQQELLKNKDESLLSTKRSIIEAINNLVNQFNDITKILREGKSLKAEGPLNDLISKNKQIQQECNQTNQIIDGAKKDANDIQERLLGIINADVLEELLQKFREKENMIENCIKTKTKAEKQHAKLEQQLTKHVDLVEDLIKKLDMFNPLHGTSSTAASQPNQEFLDEISDKIERTNELMEGLQKLKEDNIYAKEHLETSCVPLEEVGEREVPINPELEGILETLNAVSADLSAAEADIAPKAAEIVALQKEVKALIGQEVEGRLREGQNTLDVVDQDLGSCGDLHNAAEKKLKNLRDQIERAQKNQGRRDPHLLQELEGMATDSNQIEDMLGELDTKLNDQKRKKTEAKRQMDDMLKGMQGMQKFKPSQLEGVLASLDELKDKNGWIQEKLQTADAKVEQKVKDLEDLVASCDTKQEVQKSIGETEAEMADDLSNLKALIERLPNLVRQLQGTAAEMSASAGPGDDFSERKEELAEQMEELEEIAAVVEKFEESFGSLKDESDKILKQKGKSGDIHQLQKLLEQMQDNKNQLSGLLTDALDTQEQLEDVRKDIGDCEIPMLLTKRKTELSQFSTKVERLKKELTNLKKASKKTDGTKSVGDKIPQMVKEVEFKLKIIEKDKQDLVKSQAKELDTIQPLDYDDVGKASELLKRIRKFKNQVHEADQKLKDLEEIQTDIVKKMTEADLENSTDLLASKAEELRERLKEARLQLQKIQSSGEAMDGNTSTNEEEEFIQALNNEMPEVLDNIETNLGLLIEIEKLVPDVKQSVSLEKMNDLREKVEIATENVEESEGLVIKLEKEILEWNAQKKLCKRDCEMEEARNLLSDFIEDLGQEKQNTEIELQRNREKQEENRDQEMVDKDGKKVDIMKDLVKLEEEMEGYVKEIEELLTELAEREATREQLFEAFNKAIPNVILEERQRRIEQIKALKPPDKQLKRPPMLAAKKKAAKDAKAGEENGDELDTHQMLKTNCTFRNPIKELLKDLKTFNQRRKELEEKYAQMRRAVFKLKQIKLYKPVQGDAVDEMFAGYLNKAKLTIEVQRISASNYMFGTKKILAKILNGRLVIRVGGGYMNAEEFIEQYGKIEMIKMMKMEEAKGGYETQTDGRPSTAKSSLSHTNSTPGRRGTVLLNQVGDSLKEQMRAKLAQAKVYDTQNTIKSRQTMGPESMKSLGSSMRQKTMNTSNKPSTAADDKARHRASIGNLAKELHNIQSNYRSTQHGESPALGSAGKSRKLGQAKASGAGLSARGGSKSPSSGPSTGIGSGTAGSSGGSKIAQGLRASAFAGTLNKPSDSKKN